MLNVIILSAVKLSVIILNAIDPRKKVFRGRMQKWAEPKTATQAKEKKEYTQKAIYVFAFKAP